MVMLMTEHFNIYDNKYESMLKSDRTVYKLRLELLNYYENVIGEITKDVSITAQGQININYQQLTRRSCSLTLINVENKYIPSPNSPIWFDKKFKLWIGVSDGEDIYWWFQGVYIIREANMSNGVVNIEAVDKGGLLDGTLKMNMAESQYIIPSGQSITTLIRDTLMLDMGTDSSSTGDNHLHKPIDPIPPIVQYDFNNIITQSEISVDTNSYIGDMFTTIANSYGADVYYNCNGNMVLSKMADENRVDGYKYMARQWNFYNTLSSYSNANLTYSFERINSVTVCTNSNSQENVSYTAYNNNPLSELRVDTIGVRRLETQEIPYILGETTEQMKLRCQQYAEYLLLKESMKGLNISFNCPIIPHMDVNKTIEITDSRYGLDANIFVVQSITIPLSAGEMNVVATNIDWLPADVNIEGVGV